MRTTGADRPMPAKGGWSGERLGRLSLRLDAAYCTILGGGVALFAGSQAFALRRVRPGV